MSAVTEQLRCHRKEDFECIRYSKDTNTGLGFEDWHTAGGNGSAGTVAGAAGSYSARIAGTGCTATASWRTEVGSSGFHIECSGRRAGMAGWSIGVEPQSSSKGSLVQLPDRLSLSTVHTTTVDC